MTAPDLATLTRAELVRRLSLAQSFAERLVEDKRRLCQRVEDLEDKVAQLQRDVERGNEMASNFLDTLEFCDPEDVDPAAMALELGQQFAIRGK